MDIIENRNCSLRDEKRKLLEIIAEENEDTKTSTTLATVSCAISQSFGNSGMVRTASCTRCTIQGEKEDYERLVSSDESGSVKELWSVSTIGLLINKFAEGSFAVFVHGRSVLYPFFGVYLNMNGNTYNSIPAVFATIWALKIISAIFSDAFPIMGKRRIPYIVFGWLIAAGCLFSASLIHDYPEPYYAVENCTRLPSVVSNPNAPDSALFYILNLCGVLTGVGIACVSTDALIVEYAKQEPLKSRDRILAYTNIAHFGGSLMSVVIFGFGLNSVAYGGSDCDSWFDFDTILTIYGFMALFCIVSIVFLTKELTIEKKKLMPLKGHLSGIWRTIQSSLFLKMAIYIFLSGCFADVQSSASVKIRIYYAHVQPRTTALVGCVNSIFLMTSVAVYTKYFSHLSWRTTAILVKAIIIVLTMTAQLLTIFDVIRDQYFYLLADETSCTIFLGILVYIAIILSAELSNEAQEATTYGLLTTIRLLTSPISTAIGNTISAPFNVVEDFRYTRDSWADKLDVAYAVICTHAVNVLAIVAVFLFLPNNKFQLSRLKAESTFSRGKGIAFSVVIASLFATATALILLSSFPQTDCLFIVGGNGCN